MSRNRVYLKDKPKCQTTHHLFESFFRTRTQTIAITSATMRIEATIAAIRATLIGDDADSIFDGLKIVVGIVVVDVMGSAAEIDKTTSASVLTNHS